MTTVMATVTSEGQTTIPKVIRDALGKGERSRLVFVLEGDSARLLPVGGRSLTDLAGAPRPMSEAWVDAKVILRILTQDPPQQARAALDLFRAAEEGRIVLWVDASTLAECGWVLTSVYGHRCTHESLADLLLRQP